LTLKVVFISFNINTIRYKGGEKVAAYTLKEVDDKLWRKVKAVAALRGKSIKDLIIELLEKEVKKGE